MVRSAYFSGEEALKRAARVRQFAGLRPSRLATTDRQAVPGPSHERACGVTVCARNSPGTPTFGSPLRSAERSAPGASEGSEAPDVIGGPSRTRTLDPLIKRPFPASFHPSHSSLLHVTRCHVSPRRVWRSEDRARALVAA